MIKFYALLLISFLLTLLNCSKQSNIDEQSEMAKLMRKMVNEHKEVRSKIKSGKSIGDFPDYYNTIHTAKFTNESLHHKDFQAYAKSFIEAEKKLYNSAKENHVQNYKAAVNCCIQCHSNISCNGPISKIKTLYYTKD